MTTASEPPRRGRPPGKKAPRQIIRDSIAKGLTQKRVDEFIEEAMAAEITLDAYCPNCNHQMKAKGPDTKKRLDVFVGLLEQAEGRPEQRAPGELSVVIERAAR